MKDDKRKTLRQTLKSKEDTLAMQSQYEALSEEEMAEVQSKANTMAEAIKAFRMYPPDDINPKDICAKLASFKGDGQLFEADPFGALQMTSGMLYFGAKVAPWIPIEIGLIQSGLLVDHYDEASRFQLWIVENDPNTGKGTLACYKDKDSAPWFEAKVRTLLPLEHFECLVIDGVLLLPSEFNSEF